jgi:hypothetical protein
MLNENDCHYHSHYYSRLSFPHLPACCIEKRHAQPYEDSISLPALHASPCVTRNNAAGTGHEPGIFTDT